MKYRTFFTIVLLIAGLVLSSCKKDNDDDTFARPQIVLNELGHDNNKIAHAGGELHVEATIEAEGKISTVRIKIHPEGEHGTKKSLLTQFKDEWIVDTVYNEFSGLLNTVFHKHVEVPLTAPAGDYHFHFVVTDMEGQQTTIEDEFEIIITD